MTIAQSKAKKDGAISVKPGDTLTDIVSRIYKIPASKTKPHLDEFYRENKSGGLVPVGDVNRIYPGEVLYHRPQGLKQDSGLSSKRHGSGGRKASDGVKNAKTYRMKNENSLKRIRELVGQAKQRIRIAIQAVKQVTTHRGYQELFEQYFPLVSAEVQRSVIGNYELMLRMADGVEWHVQTERPVTAVTGSDAYAFALYRHYIAIYPPNFYGEKVSNQMRVGIIIHELAHYAFDAGHTSESLPNGSIAIFGGTKGADSYEGFAMALRSR